MHHQAPFCHRADERCPAATRHPIQELDSAVPDAGVAHDGPHDSDSGRQADFGVPAQSGPSSTTSWDPAGSPAFGHLDASPTSPPPRRCRCCSSSRTTVRCCHWSRRRCAGRRCSGLGGWVRGRSGRWAWPCCSGFGVQEFAVVWAARDDTREDGGQTGPRVPNRVHANWLVQVGRRVLPARQMNHLTRFQPILELLADDRRGRHATRRRQRVSWHRDAAPRELARRLIGCQLRGLRGRAAPERGASRPGHR